MHGTLEDKMRFLFASFDRDHNNSIDVFELVALLEMGWRQSESCITFFDEVRV